MSIEWVRACIPPALGIHLYWRWALLMKEGVVLCVGCSLHLFLAPALSCRERSLMTDREPCL